MTPDLKGFSRYVLVGISNTVIHWTVFFALCLGCHAPQAVGNLAGFVAAASFSFYANAVYIFSGRLSWSGYLLFMSLMGSLSLSVGHVADEQQSPLLVTVVVSSVLSLSLGYYCSRYLIFRRCS